MTASGNHGNGEAAPYDRSWVGSMPEAYERWLVPAMFQPFAVDLARRAGSFRPRRVLEIAAGTGVLTQELLASVPSADVTATDLSSAMVELGSRRAPGAAWRQADAGHLPFDDRRFNLVVCQFGVMFFPDKPAAFRQVARVLAPSGRLLFSTWDTVDTHDFAAALTAGVERAFPDDPPAFIAAVPHGYADLRQVVADLAAGGLECISAETVTLTGQAGSAFGIAAGFCAGTPLRMAIEDRGDLAASTTVIGREMRARLGDGPVTGRMTAYVIEARPHAVEPKL
jgi:SAM-dependent methyltransferase